LSKPIPVVDTHAHHEEAIERIVKQLGRSKVRIAIFDAVYSGGSRPKSIDKIEQKIESKFPKQSIINELDYLVKHKIINKSTFTNKETKRKRSAYAKIDFINANKQEIRRYVDSPKKMEKIATKRKPIINLPQGISFLKQSRKKARKYKIKKSSTYKNAKIKIAFLATNPDHLSSIRTDMEIRDVIESIQKSTNRDYVNIRHFPAARIEDFINALNEYKPNIIHFSGHGGEETLLFDNYTADEDGGVEINFDLVNEIISATNTPPVMIVFNACDTLDGAEIFLENVSVVLAMSSSISDSAACLFSAQFYGAIVSGQPVGAAVKQGKAILKVTKMDDANFPSIICKEGIDPDTLVLLN
jgi:hypothetical protein